MKEKLFVLSALFILGLSGSHLAYSQAPDKTFESLEYLVKINYPSNWSVIKGDPSFNPGEIYDSASKFFRGRSGVASFCPSSELPAEPTFYMECPVYSKISVTITAYRLPNSTTLEQFVDGEIQAITRMNEDPSLGPKELIIENNSTQILGLPIHKIVTESGDENKKAIIYAVNDNIGYEIEFIAKGQKYFSYFYPTFGEMLKSFKIIDLSLPS